MTIDKRLRKPVFGHACPSQRNTTRHYLQSRHAEMMHPKILNQFRSNSIINQNY